MTPFMPTVTLSPDALVRIEGGEVITWAECERRLLAARTPAPEVEVIWTEDAEPERDIVKEAFDEGVEHNYSFMDMTRNFYGKLLEDPTWGEATDTGRE